MQELPININPKEGKWINIMLNIIMLLLTIIILLFSINTLCEIKGSSMEPTLSHSQYVLLYKTQRAKRGDIIVCNTDDIKIIKRVIAIGGDKLVFASSNSQTVNIFLDKGDGYVQLSENYLLDNKPIDYPTYGRISSIIKVYNYTQFDSDKAQEYAIEVPKNSYFVLGDNRNNSKDSRAYGYIYKKSVIGKVALILEEESFLEKLLKLFFTGQLVHD